jgi:holin-like protein
MIESLTLLLLCQLAGEILTRGLALSLPGPVAGMGLLFGLLCWRGRKSRKNLATPAIQPELSQLTEIIFRHFSLFFIPAAVGIVAYFSLFKDYALAILAAIGLSTILTLSVTALLFQGMMRRLRKTTPGIEEER